MVERETKGLVFNIQRYSVHDGPGIRTTVFLKGCPLRCLWCCNPESQSNREEVMYIKDHCTLCGTCVAVCPRHASAIVDQEVRTDRRRCQGCGACCQACPNRAREIAGKQMTVKEVVTQVMEDSLFYRNSGGGVTLSGGEALMQPAFTAAVLQACQESGVHTVLQTCGHASETDLFAVLPYVDLLLFDLKHMNSAKHQELTGVSNQAILRNVKHISSYEIPIIIRVPVIKGANDFAENIMQLAAFVKTIPQIQAVELLPYHNYALQKYAKLEREYLWDREVPNEEHMEWFRGILAQQGVNATVI